MSVFKFGIANRQFHHNHFNYVVEVTESHAVCWKILGPERQGRPNYLETGMLRATRADESPAGAITWAHESARAWIDNYVEAHLILQDAVEAAQSKYGDN